MQLNIFQSVVPLLKEKKFNIDFDAFLNYMGQYHSNEWIYPDAVHRELGIAIKEIYDILEVCVDEGLVEQDLLPSMSEIYWKHFQNSIRDPRVC